MATKRRQFVKRVAQARAERQGEAWDADDRRDTLRRAIEKTGMTHTDFARMLDVDVRTVRRWLEGTRKIDGPTGVLLSLIFYNTKDVLFMLDAALIKDGAYS